MKQKSCNWHQQTVLPERTNTPGSGFSLRHANVVILTDETEFARLLTACWQAERQAPNITVLNSDSWREQDAPTQDRKSTRLNSSHSQISYAAFGLKKKTH